MKKVIAIVVCFSFVASAAFWRKASESQALTRASSVTSDNPTASEKLKLDSCDGVRVTVCSADSNNLTGGTLRAWYESPLVGWTRNPDLDLTIGAPAALCRTFPDIQVKVGAGAAFWANDSVTGPASAAVVYMECYNQD